MRDKKGIGAVFAWIFILVAGALIITVFIILAQGQAANAKDSLSQKAFQNVNTIIATQQTTSDIATSIPIPESKLRLSCTVFEQNGEVALLNQLDIGGYAQPLDTQLIVGRDMQADRLNVFSKKWNAPFTAANILYVSSPEELLVYTVDGNFVQDFNETIPENINVFDQSTFSNDQSVRGYQNTRIVHISTTTPPTTEASTNFPDWMKAYDEDESLFIYVQPKGDLGNPTDITAQGTVTYYVPDIDGNLAKSTSFTYVGEAMMLAYIWQADEDRAACLQHKLAKTLNAQIDIQLKRMELLRGKYGQQTVCYSRLSPTSLEALQDDIARDTSLDLDVGKLYDFSELYESQQNVDITNENLRVGESCATIY